MLCDLLPGGLLELDWPAFDWFPAFCRPLLERADLEALDDWLAAAGRAEAEGNEGRADGNDGGDGRDGRVEAEGNEGTAGEVDDGSDGRDGSEDDGSWLGLGKLGSVGRRLSFEGAQPEDAPMPMVTVTVTAHTASIADANDRRPCWRWFIGDSWIRRYL